MSCFLRKEERCEDWEEAREQTEFDLQLMPSRCDWDDVVADVVAVEHSIDLTRYLLVSTVMRSAWSSGI